MTDIHLIKNDIAEDGDPFSSFFLMSKMIPEIVYIKVDLPALLAPKIPVILSRWQIALILLIANEFS
jgi:hypothetical protein